MQQERERERETSTDKMKLLYPLTGRGRQKQMLRDNKEREKIQLVLFMSTINVIYAHIIGPPDWNPGMYHIRFVSFCRGRR
jgi:hypothetical protein